MGLTLAASAALAAPAGVTVAPGFGSVTASLAASPPSDAAPSPWASGKFGTEYVSGTPSFTITVTADVTLAFRLRSQKGSVSHAYLRCAALRKLFDVDIDEDRDHVGEADKKFITAWQTAILPPGRYDIHFAHHYGGKVTEQATLEVLDLTPKAVTLGSHFALAAGTLTELRAAPWGSPRIVLDANAPRPFADLLDGPCAHGRRPDAPMATIELPDGAADLRVALRRGDAAAVYVRHSSGKDWCSRPVGSGETPMAAVTLGSVPPGRLELWPIQPNEQSGTLPAHPKGVVYFDAEVEDLGTPRPVAWGGGTSKWVVDGPVPEALVARVLADGRGATRPLCENDSSPHAKAGPVTPDLLLEVRRPVDGLVFRTVGLGDVTLSFEGPFGPDGRAVGGGEVKETCVVGHRADVLTKVSLGDPRGRPGRAEPGLYAVRVGFTGEGRAAAVVLRDASSHEDVLAQRFPVPEPSPPARELSLGERLAGLYFVGVPSCAYDLGERNRFAALSVDTRQALFLAAPKSLFVYAAFDLDAASAAGASDRWWTTPPQPLTELPKANEPLLVLSTQTSGSEGAASRLLLLAADGTVWQVDSRYLALSPKGPVAVPAAARNVVALWDDHVDEQAALRRMAAPDKVKAIAAVEATLAKEQACFNRKLKGKENFVLIRITRGGSTYNNPSYSDSVLAKARKACNRGGDAAITALLPKLEASYKARVAVGLAKIAAAWSH